jgi:hypothetical protein
VTFANGGTVVVLRRVELIDGIGTASVLGHTLTVEFGDSWFVQQQGLKGILHSEK